MATGYEYDPSLSTEYSQTTNQGKVTVEEWDPMLQQFQSILNFGFASNYLTSALAVGGLQAEGEYQSIRHVPCEFHDGKGKCFKGRHCVKYHPIGKPPAKPTALQKSIYYASNLPERAKEEPTPNIQFVAKVCHIESPLEFYIIPTHHVGCLCGCDGEVTKSPFKDVIQGLQGLDIVDKTLSEYMNAKKRTFQLPEYEAWQLVAVYCQIVLHGFSQSHQWRWYRAMVLENVMYDADPYTKVSVRVQLLDCGSTLRVPLHDVASLPYKFVTIAPLAFKCELDGIIPVAPKFSTKAVTHFKTFVATKELIVTVKSRKLKPSKDSDCPMKRQLRDDFLYSVDLNVKEMPTTEYSETESHCNATPSFQEVSKTRSDYVGLCSSANGLKAQRQRELERQVNVKTRNISHQLHMEGYCVLSHPFPRRPMLLNAGLPTLSHGGALLLTPDDANLNDDNNVKAYNAIMKREKARVFDVFTRQDKYFGSCVDKLKFEFPRKDDNGWVYSLDPDERVFALGVQADANSKAPYVSTVDEDDDDEGSESSFLFS